MVVDRMFDLGALIQKYHNNEQSQNTVKNSALLKTRNYPKHNRRKCCCSPESKVSEQEDYIHYLLELSNRPV